MDAVEKGCCVIKRLSIQQGLPRWGGICGTALAFLSISLVLSSRLLSLSLPLPLSLDHFLSLSLPLALSLSRHSSGETPLGEGAREVSVRHHLPQREFFIDSLLVQIHFIIELIWWTGLAPSEFEFHLPHPPSLSTFNKITPHTEPHLADDVRLKGTIPWTYPRIGATTASVDSSV